jgi:type VI protein secretion system component VasK
MMLSFLRMLFGLFTPRVFIALGILLSGIVLIFYVPFIARQAWYIKVAIAVVIVLLVILSLLLRRRKEKKAAAALEESLDRDAARQARDTAPGKGADIEIVREKLRAAIQAVKQSQKAKGKSGDSALYTLPWFMVAGPSGCGKSTALRRSGLTFYAVGGEQDEEPSIKGLGGTRDCDWWFADGGVILDTSGRWVEQSAQSGEREEWLGFLDLLRTYRSREPINGLILMMSLPDLARDGAEEAERVGRMIRSRIDELIARLGIVFPVYLVFTKTDLLRGFLETFGDMDLADRKQIWGTTFGGGETGAEPGQDCQAELETLLERLEQRRALRYADLPKDELSVKGADVFSFPNQLRSALPSITKFIDAVFKPNRFQSDNPWFRGFYLTSGTQEGLPVDLITQAASEGTDGDAGGTMQLGDGKSYFLEDAFSKVYFPGGTLVRPSVGRAGLWKRRRYFAFGIGAGVLLGIAGLLSLLYSINTGKLEDLNRAAHEVDRLTTSPSRKEMTEDLGRIDALRRCLVSMRRLNSGTVGFLQLGTYKGREAYAKGEKLFAKALYERVLNIIVADLLDRLDGEPGDNELLDQLDWWVCCKYLLEPEQLPYGRSLVAEVTARSANVNDPNLKYTIEFLANSSGALEEAPRHRYQPPAYQKDLLGRVQQRLNRRFSDTTMLLSLLERTRRGCDPGSVPGTYSKVFTSDGAHDFVKQVKLTEAFLNSCGQVRSFERATLNRSAIYSQFSDYYVKKQANGLKSCDVGTVGPDGAGKYLEDVVATGSRVDLAISTAYRQLDFKAADGDLFQIANKGESVLKFGNGILKSDAGNAYVGHVTKIKAALESGDRSAVDKEVSDLRAFAKQCNTNANPIGFALSELLIRPINVATVGARRADQEEMADELLSRWNAVYSEYQATLEGKYPIEPRATGDFVRLDDFREFFKEGGVIDKFYRENLSNFYDENGRLISAKDAPIVSQGIRNCIRDAASIRKSFFNSGKLEVRFRVSGGDLRTMEPRCVTPLSFSFYAGEQVYSYDFSPVSSKSIQWPDDEGGGNARLSCVFKKGGKEETVDVFDIEDPWGVLRAFSAGANASAWNATAVALEWPKELPDGCEIIARFTVEPTSIRHPLKGKLFPFKCPRG